MYRVPKDVHALRGISIAGVVVALAASTASANPPGCRPLPHGARVVARDSYVVVVASRGIIRYCSRRVHWRSLTTVAGVLNLRLRGPYLAIEEPGLAFLVETLVDVRNGRQNGAPIGSGLLSPEPPLFSADGVLTWIEARPDFLTPDAYKMGGMFGDPGVDALSLRGEVNLDASPVSDLANLRLVGRTVSWTDSGAPRSVTVATG